MSACYIFNSSPAISSWACSHTLILQVTFTYLFCQHLILHSSYRPVCNLFICYLCRKFIILPTHSFTKWSSLDHLSTSLTKVVFGACPKRRYNFLIVHTLALTLWNFSFVFRITLYQKLRSFVPQIVWNMPYLLSNFLTKPIPLFK